MEKAGFRLFFSRTNCYFINFPPLYAAGQQREVVMRRSLLCFVFFVLFVFSIFAPAARAAEQHRLTGFVEAVVFPPHNEYDPQPSVEPFSRRYVARYGLYVKLKFFLIENNEGGGVFISTSPRFFFGAARPQTAYGWQAPPICCNYQWSIGWESPTHRWEIKISHGGKKGMSDRYKGARCLYTDLSVKYRFGFF